MNTPADRKTFSDFAKREFLEHKGRKGLASSSQAADSGDLRPVLERIDARLARMERLHEELLVKRPKQKDIAKQMGVHPTTLSRRRQRERLRRMVGGGSV